MKRSIFYIGVLIAIFLLSSWVSFYGQIPRDYDFLPYDLRVKAGTNGDGGLAYPPGMIPADPQHPILTSPLPLGRHDLGWSGDLIVEWARDWEVVAVVEGTTGTPAILAANYGAGHIVYVTNQLAPHEKLVYNILGWHFGTLRQRAARMAVMIDVPLGQILDDWDRCFNAVQQIGSDESLSVQSERIHQYQLNQEDLDNFDVLILAVRWGDGYYAGDWRWSSHNRDPAILEFVKKGGLLLLPEAGFYDDYGIPFPNGLVVPLPVKALQDVFLGGQAFAMVALSLSAIGVTYSIKKDYSLLNRRYDVIAGYLFLATILWVMVPLCGGWLLPYKTTVLLCAFMTDVAAATIALTSFRNAAIAD